MLTIAARLAIDTSRRARPTAHELPELPVEDGRPAYAQIEHLADGLPPTERAALVLRYAYDLSYDDIAVALGLHARGRPPGRLVRSPASQIREDP